MRTFPGEDIMFALSFSKLFLKPMVFLSCIAPLSVGVLFSSDGSLALAETAVDTPREVQRSPPPVAAKPTGKKQPDKKEALAKKSLGDIKQVHALGDIYLTGQPSVEDLRVLKKQGIETIITLRMPGEVPWDEAAAVKKEGMKFVSVPFQGPDELKPKVFDEVLKILRDKKKRGPTVLHCGSANRVGALWYAHRVLEGKLSPEAALKEAKTVGLRTPAYLDKAQEYVEAQQSQTPREK